jgi:hypothetical protein
MKLIVFFLTAVLGLSAHAAAVSIVGKPTGNCATPGVTSVAYLSSYTDGVDENGRVHLSFMVTEVGCNGKNPVNRKILANNYNLYFVNTEYSKDVRYSHQLLNAFVLEAQFSFVPSVFFAEYSLRHYDVAFYPSSGALTYKWLVTISADPVTGQIRTFIK